jgi:hypothetical protein
VSPDGRWIADQSNEGSDPDEIHVRPFPKTDAGHTKISSGGGFWPVPLGAPFAYGAQTPLPGAWTKYSLGGGLGRGYDVSKDGRQFLTVKPLKAAEKRGQSLTVVTHWLDVLRAAMKGKSR